MQKNALVPAVLFSTGFAAAHCPLCTIGAAGAAGAAVWMGLSKISVSVLLGGFSMSIGIWFSKIIKRKYFPMQKKIIAGLIFLATLIPLISMFSAVGPVYIPFLGKYGKTIAVNYSLYSSLLGAFIVLISPKINKKIKAATKKHFPFQGIALTITYLIIAAAIIQIII